jgi:hypothetical protein
MEELKILAGNIEETKIRFLTLVKKYTKDNSLVFKKDEFLEIASIMKKLIIKKLQNIT